jgi:hypothetical protein
MTSRRLHEKENNVKRLAMNCLNCGSEAVSSLTEAVPPVFKMEVVHYACGAVLKNTTGARGRSGRLSHEGCRREPVEMAS